MTEEFGRPEQTFIVYVMDWRRNKKGDGEECHAPCEIPNTDDRGKTSLSMVIGSQLSKLVVT